MKEYPQNGRACNGAQDEPGYVAERSASRREQPFIFISGGCRSGKSAFAQHLAETMRPDCLYLATAQVRDEEMRRRVDRHRRERGRNWATHELLPGHLLAGQDESERFLNRLARPGVCILLDCLTLWVSACMEYAHDAFLPSGGEQAHSEEYVFQTTRQACGMLLEALWKAPAPVVIVSGEVGLGLVPESPVGREFRDLAGLANQQAARMARTAVFMVSGLPLLVKGTLPTEMSAS